MKKLFIGGDEGDRNLGLQFAGLALSQLSYTPICQFALLFFYTA